MANSDDLSSILRQYFYDLTPDQIAKSPAKPRDSAKLLIYSRGSDTVTFDRFSNIDMYLPKRSVLVFNDTKVIPAKATLFTKRGTTRSALFITHSNTVCKVILNRTTKVGSKLFINKNTFFTVADNDGKYFYLKPHFHNSVIETLEKYGTTPIPPYLKGVNIEDKKLRKSYQTVFAKSPGSIAAPTASLHFTNRLLEKLKKKGFAIEFITLHVNEGTFAPLTQEALVSHTLHKELVTIDNKTKTRMNRYISERRQIVPVGTTVVRALESLSAQNGTLVKENTNTELFIQPGYEYKVCKNLITNFHVPSSSLMMLVASFTGRRKLLEIYRTAQKNNFRFLSFGDGMLIV